MVAPYSITSKADTPQTLAQMESSAADKQRKQAQALAWKAFRGELADPLKVEKDNLNDNVKANRCEPIVNIGVAFLFGQPLKVLNGETQDETSEQETPDSDEDSDPIQACIDATWGGDDDERMTILAECATNGGVCGEPFLKLIPPQQDGDAPRIVNLDPQLLDIVTAPDDCRLHLAYLISYPTSSGYQWKQIISRVDLTSVLSNPFTTPELNPTWTITNFSRRSVQTGIAASTNTASWEQVGASEDWPYPFPPIFTCQNLPNPNETWGRPDLTPDLIETNKVINFLQSNISRIIKHHGHPLTYAVNMRADQISVAIGEILCLPSPDSKLEALAPMDNFAGLLAVLEHLLSNMDEQSRVPAVALGRLVDLPKGNISGVALKLLFQPIVQKTLAKQRLYGTLIRQVTRAALVCAGHIPLERYQDYKINLPWQNLLPIDDLLAAQTAQILKAIGVSDSTIMGELGYDSDQEAEKSAQEDAKKMTMYSRGTGFPVASPPMPAAPTQPVQQQATPAEWPFMGREGGNQ